MKHIFILACMIIFTGRAFADAEFTPCTAQDFQFLKQELSKDKILQGRDFEDQVHQLVLSGNGNGCEVELGDGANALPGYATKVFNIQSATKVFRITIQAKTGESPNIFIQ